MIAKRVALLNYFIWLLIFMSYHVILLSLTNNNKYGR